MKCPFCGYTDSKVIDSRTTSDKDMIRRRRECLSCQERFTTIEQVEILQPMIVKKDGRREAFEPQKLMRGLRKACEKRPVSIDALEKIVNRIQQAIEEKGEKEIPSREIGAQVMVALHALDDVAYVRFASVYREFKDIEEFLSELQELLKNQNKSETD
jgi:transcriptional repressor NrdR